MIFALGTGGGSVSTLSDIIAAMTELFSFFTSLFSDLFTTITTTPIIWVPLALTLLFMVVWKVPKMVKKLRKV